MKTIGIGGLVAVATLLASFSAGAAEKSSDANDCRQETKRVAVWPRTAPKAPQMARFEERELTICGGKVVSSRPVPKEQLHANDTES